MLEDESVDVVHLTTPNDLHYAQAKRALAAGKHVVCEKPLAMTSEQSEELVDLAERSGLVHCTNFNIRFYPIVQEARERVRAGELGDVWNVHGGYLQDWLATPEDWNWRLEPARGGDLRAVGDIGSHWMDLAQFVTGSRIVEVFADLATTIPVRRRPVGEVETFASAADVERVDAPMSTEDIAHILVRFESGARGSCVLSQVSFGRKNAIRVEVDGSRGTLAWDGERHEELWLGSRERGNEVLPTERAPDASGLGRAHTPPRRACRGLRRHVPRAVSRGLRRRRARRAVRRAGLPELPGRTCRECPLRRGRALESRRSVGSDRVIAGRRSG